MASSGPTPRASWLDIAPSSPFSLANIPFGIISTASNSTPRPAIAISEHVLDLSAFSKADGFSGSSELKQALDDVFSNPTLNAFAGKGRPVHRQTRAYLQDIFAADTPYAQLLKDNQHVRDAALLPISEVTNHVPMSIGDYTDFYVGKHHAFNVGVLFRGAANALQPNYTHLPVAYHGRASSIVISGTPITRPWGQVKIPDKGPTFKPSARLDLELEMGMFVCGSNEMGKPIPIAKAEEYIFGYVLLNDWSARDIQAFEYVPLGPFTAKNLGSSISPWIVLADALEGFKTAGIENETEYARYLREPAETKGKNVLGIELEVQLITAKGNKKTISKSNSRHLLWSWPQMITHHTITGCNLQTGDLLGSGTISGPDAGTVGSLLEQTGGGKTKIEIGEGEERTFLEDGDTLVIRGFAGQEGALVGFGEVVGTIEPALPSSHFD